MKNTRKTFMRLLVALLLISVPAASNAVAQNREAHFISARAGGVNFVSGDVTTRRADEKDWGRLSVKDNLRSGDAVRAVGRVEVLLNPGSYLRAGDGAEFELTNASLDDLQVNLTRGGIVIEATGYDNLELSIVVVTPLARVRLVRSGLYRLNVGPSGVTEVAVQKGRAIIGSAPETIIKGGKVARIGASGVEIAKFDKNSRDALDQWRRERGRELARINDKLANRNTNALLARTSFNGMFSASNRYDPLGLWMWSAQFGSYTFLPFSSRCRSPYGFWYGSSFNPFGYGCGSCRPQDYRPNGNGVSTSTPVITYNPGGTGSGGSRPTGGSPMPTAPPTPTFDRGERIRERERTIEPGFRPNDQ